MAARDNYRLVPAKLRELRGDRYQREIAAAAGISLSYYSQLERPADERPGLRRKGADPDVRRAIAAALGVPVEDIQEPDADADPAGVAA